MTISSIGSTTNAQQTSAANSFNQSFNDFKNIGSAIQSGNLTTAQSALTAFQSDLQSNSGQNPLSRLFNNSSKFSDDLTSLQTALKSNDSASAQNAFKTLVKDMQGAMKTQAPHGHRHHHRVDSDGDNDGSTATAATSATDSTTGSTSAGSTLDVQA